MNAYDFIANEEGFSPTPYMCSEGYPTVGYGQRIGPRGAMLEMYQFTMPEPVAREWLAQNVRAIADQLASRSFYCQCNGARAIVLLSMAYQMGVSGLLKFRKMLAAIEDNDWEEAARQALDSRWAKQTPARAKRHAEILRTGVMP
jgi:lysozyme